jgi:hypothetical protein
VRRADAQVGAKRGREQRRLLRTPGDHRPDLLRWQHPRVRAVDGEPASGQVDEAQQSEHNRRLA